MGATHLSPTPPPTERRARLLGAVVTGGVLAICLVRLIGFVQANAVDVLFDDQWNSLQPLFEGRGPWSAFFFQHGPPRLGLGGLIDWYLYQATGWDVRAEAWAGVATLLLSTLVALALAVRLRGHLRWTDAGFPLLLLSTRHWETLTFTPFLAAHILPLLLTLLLAYTWSHEAGRVRAIALGLLGVLALFTGYAMSAFAVTTALTALSWWRPGSVIAPAERRSFLLLLLLAGSAVAVFSVNYQWSTGTMAWRFPVPNWWDYPRFGALMFTNLLGWRAVTLTSTAIGAVLLVLVTLGFAAATRTLWRRQPTPRARAIWLLGGTSLAFAALTAVGRLPSTIEAAFLWRYTTLMMPALCALALGAESWAQARSPKIQATVGVAWLTLAGIIWGSTTPETYAATIAKEKRLWVASYLATRDLAAANRASNYWVYFQNPDSPDIAAKLHWLEQNHLSFFRETAATPSP